MKLLPFRFFGVVAIVILLMTIVTPCFSQGGAMPPETDGKPQLSINGALGSTIINGQAYQYFSLRPDIPIWRFGIGLDLSFYFDEDGKLREDDWDETADYIEKIYYIRYGKPGQPLYVRVGALNPITLGYGLIMRRYSNAIEWPQTKRTGLHSQVKIGNIGVEAVMNNFRELNSPGLVAGRVTYTMNFIKPVVFGATIAYDGNQYLGAKDDDDDGFPNHQDLFPDENDRSHVDWLRSILSSRQMELLIESGDLPNIPDKLVSIYDRDAPVTEFGIDVGVALLQNDIMTLWAYAQAAQIADYGRGYTIPGLRWTMGPFYAGAEYRIFEAEFLGDFFNYSYEIERVAWDEASQNYITKEEHLANIPSAQGYFVDAGADLFNIVDIYAAYQNMMYDNSDLPNQSVQATVSLNTAKIPRLDLAEGFYMQPNADKLFSKDSDGTTVGYTIGTAMGDGMMLKYDNRVIYRNGEPNRIMTIEAVMKFK